MIIDFHAHIFPDGLAERALSNLSAKSGLCPVCAGDKSSTVAFLKANGITKMVSPNIAVLARNMEKVNDFAISSADDFVISFGSLHPDGDWSEELKRLSDHGIKGLKFHPEYQDFNIDDPKCDKMYEACVVAGFVMLFHCGTDLAYHTPQKASPSRTANFARKFKGARIVCAHLGGFKESDSVIAELAGLGLYADLAALGMEFDSPIEKNLDRKKLNDVVRMFGTDRVLFGTDCPWQSPQSGLKVLELLDLTAQERENILYRNAQQLLQI